MTKREQIKLIIEYLFANIITLRMSMLIRNRVMEEKSFVKYIFWKTLWICNCSSLKIASLFVPRLKFILNEIKVIVLFNIDNLINKILASHRLLSNNSLIECIICMDKSIILNFLYPCGHGVICNNCKDKIKVCPICKRSIISNLRIFPAT